VTRLCDDDEEEEEELCYEAAPEHRREGTVRVTVRTFFEVKGRCLLFVCIRQGQDEGLGLLAQTDTARAEDRAQGCAERA
jgi:hypothetical protein